MGTCLDQIQTWALLTFLALITFFPQKDKTEKAKIFLFSVQVSWEQHKGRRGGREDPSSRSSIISHAMRGVIVIPQVRSFWSSRIIRIMKAE